MDAWAAEEHIDDALLTVLNGVMEGCAPLRILPVHVRPVLNESGHDLLLAPLGGQVQRALPVGRLLSAYSTPCKIVLKKAPRSWFLRLNWLQSPPPPPSANRARMSAYLTTLYNKALANSK